MPQCNTESNNFNSHGDRGNVSQTVTRFVDAVEDLATELDAPESVTEEIIDAGQDMADLVEETAQQSSENRDQIEDNTDEIDAEKERRSAEIEGCHNRISNTVEDVVSGDDTPTPNVGETGIQRDDLTPIEQLARSTNIDDVTDSPTVRRAVSLFKNLPSWGSKTPKGIVLKPADNPVALLEADRGESLCWKQYYRAAETLEQLSEGSVTFFDSDRHGKMVCLHEQSEAYDRVINGSLSPSSVGAEG